MPAVYVYIMTYDGGCGPCHAGELTTLNLCKPKIRERACPGDLVVGLVGKNLSANSAHAHGDILWAGVVASKMAMSTYWQAFPDRADAIYAYDTGVGVLRAHQPWGERDVNKDTGGKCALIFGRVLRFSHVSVNASNAGLCFGKYGHTGPGRPTLVTQVPPAAIDALLHTLDHVADPAGASFHLSVMGPHRC